MQLKLKEMVARVQQRLAANPPDSETVRRIEESLHDPDAE